MADLMHGTMYMAVEDGPFHRLSNAAIEFARTVDCKHVRAAAEKVAFDARAMAPTSVRIALTSWHGRAFAFGHSIGPDWLRAHPGRRLPGSLRNRRLAKKRAQYLERWARKEGLA